MATQPRLTFYDIAPAPPPEQTAFAPNPWKSRLALNFKALPYTTTWVPLPSIASLRSQTLGLPPTRLFADGTPFHTLPILHDPLSPSSSSSSPPNNNNNNNNNNTTPPGALLADTLDIAVHLDERYPHAGAGPLFPPADLTFLPDEHPSRTTTLLIPLSDVSVPAYAEPYALFNRDVDTLFTEHTGLMAHAMPLEPETAPAARAEFVRRAGLSSWADLKLEGEARAAVWSSLRDALAPLARLFARDPSGPFVLGRTACYADFIVGAWLRMMVRTLPGDEWRDARGWHAGVFGDLHDALDRYAEVR